MISEGAMDRKLLVNAFLPATGVEDPHRFAGRRTEIEELTDALQTIGSVPLIYGDRGLGKSSLALQLSRIAKGDVELLADLDLEDLALNEEDRFIVLMVSCTDDTKNLAGLLQLMINAVDSLKDHADRDKRSDHVLIDKKTKRRLSFKVFSSETTKTYSAGKKELDTSKFSRQERLLRLAELLTDTYQQPVLFIIDEFDRLKSTAGVASFFKSHSTEFLKFALVGIADTEGDLLRDHGSLGRQLIPVPVAKMSKPELESIFDRTQSYLGVNGFEVEFTEEAAARAARVAAGFPWFMHLLGQEALLEVSGKGGHAVETSHIEAALKDLPRRRLAKQFNDRYNLAVRDSSSREYVLRLFAEWAGDDIPTSEIYPRAVQLGVTGPSTYVGHLTKDQCGKVLVPSPQQKRLYRFSDGMFKAYVRMRGSVYRDVDKVVRASMSQPRP